MGARPHHPWSADDSGTYTLGASERAQHPKLPEITILPLVKRIFALELKSLDPKMVDSPETLFFLCGTFLCMNTEGHTKIDSGFQWEPEPL